MNTKLQIFDSTLRDGAQSANISFSVVFRAPNASRNSKNASPSVRSAKPAAISSATPMYFTAAPPFTGPEC